MLALVRQGLGMTLLPESADDRLSGLIRLPVEHAGVSREIGLITRAGQTLGPAAARFSALVR
ncbi:LysR family regulator, partial [Pseudomonas asplenii]